MPMIDCPECGEPIDLPAHKLETGHHVIQCPDCEVRVQYAAELEIDDIELLDEEE